MVACSPCPIGAAIETRLLPAPHKSFKHHQVVRRQQLDQVKSHHNGLATDNEKSDYIQQCKEQCEAFSEVIKHLFPIVLSSINSLLSPQLASHGSSWLAQMADNREEDLAKIKHQRKVR